ncbi:hypothetical protein A9179_20140 [Pseudomonas alcaligenes]|uniref:ABC transporter domain-containing protein n=1 Tax=Aquipseudomonas alcaligenes TaxID=43263 RepID=A0ABR7S4T4_AQUAC|nr:ABC transporter ATP-binding protein [Pseudomonas alcaligenes]MBC9252581.1 hypothetical protein [Pseudomonas alcaligenes]
MDNLAISIQDVSKAYKLYKSSSDRLKEALHPLARKYHRDFYAVRNLSLDIGKGDIIGILGRNGCGKSTLLKLISGVLQPNTGSIRVNGKITALLELGAGFNPEFTGRQNIAFYSTLLGLDSAQVAAATPKIIEFAELNEFIDQPVRTYSSGMKSRLGFAVAIHVDPDILILDEILAVGDALFKRKCYAKMQEFFEAGKTIIYVSHEIDSISQLCKRAIFMDAGEIICDGPANVIVKKYHQYLYSPPETQKILKATFKDSGNVPDQHTPAATHSPNSAYHIDNFTPKSLIEYRNEDIDIDTPLILDDSGKPVNVLVFGQRYKYVVTYTSRSQKTFSNVAFGFEIKNQKGLAICSIESTRSYTQGLTCKQLMPGEKITASFEFHARFPGGVYFTNHGISSFANGEQQVLNRKVDAYCFKVMDSSQRIYGGLYSGIDTVFIDSYNNQLEFPVC